MDRKEILEKKRQRLLELRKRREEISLLNVDRLLPPVVPEISTKIDFAVQVDLIPQVSDHSSEPIRTEPVQVESNGHVHKFDKAVQTHFEDLDSEEENQDDIKAGNDLNENGHAETKELVVSAEDLLKNEISNHEVRDEAEIIKDALEAELQNIGSTFRFSKLRLGGDTVDDVKMQDVAPFNEIPGVSGFFERPISSIDVCPKFPELLLVAYGANNHTSKDAAKQNVFTSLGLAIVFNMTSQPPVPEFFLQCTFEITTVQFDKSNPYRVIGGLANGRIVIWDLSKVEPSKVAVLPILQTTTLASIVEKQNKLYIHHTSPIVSLLQLDLNNHESSSIVSVSSDGIINSWSPNFLAFPKLDSIRISTGTDRLKDNISVSNAIMVHNAHIFSSKDRMVHVPEYRFLNQLVVGSKNGSLYRLSNNQKKQYIESVFDCPDDVPGQNTHIHSISDIAELYISSTSSFLVSSHYDWSLRLWDLNSPSPILTIPTSMIITGIYPRPSHSQQIITIGYVNPPEVGVCIDFWDFRLKAMSPVYSIGVTKKSVQSISAKFDHEGKRFFVAFDDGDVKIWEVEDMRLQSESEILKTNEADETLETLLKR